MTKVLYQTFTQTLSYIQGFRSFERVQQSKFSISCTNLNKRTILRCVWWNKRVIDLGSFCRYRKVCIFANLGIVLIWSCFASCPLFLLFYVSLRNLCSCTHRRNPYLACKLPAIIVDCYSIQGSRVVQFWNTVHAKEQQQQWLFYKTITNDSAVLQF